MSTKAKVAAVSRYINSFEYNHTGQGYFNLRRDRGVKHVTTTAKDIMREALPIQCVEAVFVAFFLTADMLDLQRIPLSFKSQRNEKTHRHIVLALFDTNLNLWGALGISRKSSLQYKQLKFDSLSSLVAEFRRSYEDCSHALVKVYVGLPMPHNLYSMEPVKWRVLKLSIVDGFASQNNEKLDRYAKDAGWLREHYGRCGKLPAPYSDEDGDDRKEGDDDPVATSPCDASRRRSATMRRRSSCGNGAGVTNTVGKSCSHKRHLGINNNRK